MVPSRTVLGAQLSLAGVLGGEGDNETGGDYIREESQGSTASRFGLS